MPTELTATALSSDGSGIARTPDGLVVFVPGLLPGESGLVSLGKTKGSYAPGELLELTSVPSPLRRTPPCPWQAQCGGCPLQHMEDAAQTPWKRAWFLEAMRRIGRLGGEALEFLDSQTRLEAGASFGYRTSVTFQLEGNRLGFYSRGTRELVEISSCLLADPGIGRWLPLVREALQRNPVRGKARLRLTAGHGQVGFALENAQGALGRELERLGAREGMLETGWGLRVHSAGFVQPHREAPGRYKAQIQASLAAWKSGAPGGPLLAFDLYAGSGAWTDVLCGELGPQAWCIAAEEAPSSCAAWRENQAARDWRAELVSGTTAEFLQMSRRSPQVVVANPPRSGLGPQVADAVGRCLAPQGLLVLISCDFASLARDIRCLLDCGLQIVDSYVFDAFPQTRHGEAIVSMRKAAGGPGGK